MTEWFETIRRIGEESDRKQKELEDALETSLPTAIADLPKKRDEELIELMLQFHGARMYPRETAIRQKFHQACKAELLARLAKRWSK